MSCLENMLQPSSARFGKAVGDESGMCATMLLRALFVLARLAQVPMGPNTSPIAALNKSQPVMLFSNPVGDLDASPTMRSTFRPHSPVFVVL